MAVALSYALGVVALAVALAIGLTAPVGAEGELVVDDPVQTMITPDGSASGNVVRITRDYNNDGLADVAIGFEDECGNKTCSFELFLRTHDGRYKRVGTMGGLPFGFRIVPLTIGKARWETCSAIGGIVGFNSAIISMEGITEESGRTLSEGEVDVLCRWPGPYTWEVCDGAELRSTHACSWARRSWP